MFTAKGTDFDMSKITTDYYAGLPVEQFTLATAWATRNEHNDRSSRLVRPFPRSGVHAIFQEEAEARAWWMCR